MLRIYLTIGYLTSMLIQTLIKHRDLSWWLFQIGFLILLLIVWWFVLFIKKHFIKNKSNLDILLFNKDVYSQCQNCKNKKYELFGKLYCKSEGIFKINELKKLEYCASQNLKNI